MKAPECDGSSFRGFDNEELVERLLADAVLGDAVRFILHSRQVGNDVGRIDEHRLQDANVPGFS